MNTAHISYYQCLQQDLQDVSTTDALGEKRNADEGISTNYSGYDAAFKERALKKLDSGQRLKQVATTMGISYKTLQRWKRQRSSTQASPLSKDQMKADSSVPGTHSVLDAKSAQPSVTLLNELITYTSGVSTNTLHRWKKSG